jgi:hypothetical protein
VRDLSWWMKTVRSDGREMNDEEKDESDEDDEDVGKGGCNMNLAVSF